MLASLLGAHRVLTKCNKKYCFLNLSASGDTHMLGRTAHVAHGMIQRIPICTYDLIRLVAWGAHGALRLLQEICISEPERLWPSSPVRMERLIGPQDAAKTFRASDIARCVVWAAQMLLAIFRCSGDARKRLT